MVHGLKQFWATESIGITEEIIVPQTECMFPPDAKFDWMAGQYKVGLHWKSCKPVLRFIWWDDVLSEHPKIRQYRFCCLVFGLTPSSVILNRVIQYQLTFTGRKTLIQLSCYSCPYYVDDFLGGSQVKEEDLKVY